MKSTIAPRPPSTTVPLLIFVVLHVIIFFPVTRLLLPILDGLLVHGSVPDAR